MTNQDELAAQQCEDFAIECLRTALGLGNKSFHVARFETDNNPNRDGVMIGVNFSKFDPNTQEDLKDALRRVIHICETA
jgi:hypothetical protein